MDAAALQRIARLARLELEPAELERLAHDLTALLHDIDALRAALSGAYEMGAPQDAALPVALDPDSAPIADPAAPDGLHMPVSYLAPEWRDGFFTVPRLSRPSQEDAG